MGKREKEPKPQPVFFLRLNGEREVCTPDNAMAFLHENEEHDHIFLIDHENDGHYSGRYVWRDFITEGGKAFDDLIKYMINNGYSVENHDELDANDLANYYKAHPEKLTLKTQDLTPRKEKIIQYFHYMLENELIIDEDFKSDGDFYL